MATVSGGGKRERFRFIHRYGTELGVKYLCDWLQVSRSGYYAWRSRCESQHTRDDRELAEKIKQIHDASGETYGSPRVHCTLQKQGIRVGQKRVARLMQVQGLQGRIVKVTTRHPGQKAFQKGGENIAMEAGDTSDINQIWVSDITYIKLGNSWRLLIVIMDRHSRRILGWSLGQSRTTTDTARVLKRVIKHRQAGTDIIFHTDRGIEYRGHEFQAVLKANGLVASVNRSGFCTDNAHMESFFHSLKTELIRGRTFESEKALRSALHRYINRFYNEKRIHTGIGNMAPVEYEKLAA